MEESVLVSGRWDGRGERERGYLPLDEVLYVGTVVIPHEHPDATHLLHINNLTHPYRYIGGSRGP